MSEYTLTTEQVREYYAGDLGEHERLAPENYERFVADNRKQFDRWLAQHDEEIVARALAAQSAGGVCQVFDADLAWEGWVGDAKALIEGENE